MVANHNPQFQDRPADQLFFVPRLEPGTPSVDLDQSLQGHVSLVENSDTLDETVIVAENQQGPSRK